MSVEKLRVRTLAHGVQPKQDFLKKILRVELMRFGMIVFELIFDQVIEIRESRIILCSHPDKVAPIRDAPFLIQLRQHDLDGVDVSIAEIFIGAEEVLEERYVL